MIRNVDHNRIFLVVHEFFLNVSVVFDIWFDSCFGRTQSNYMMCQNTENVMN